MKFKSLVPFIPIVLFFFFLSGTVQAQAPAARPSPTPQPKPSPSLEKQFFKNILLDQKAIWTSPFRLHSGDGRWLAPFVIGTGALMATDRMTGDEMAEASNGVRHASRIISYGGSTYGVGAVALSFYALGRAKNDERARETGLLGAEALIDTGIVVTALKEIAQRARPMSGRDRSEFFDGGSSFPSGHSIQAWSLATIVANEYHDHPMVQIAAYGIASAVSLSRFTGRNHYLSDVLVGSGLGYGIGRYVYRTHHRKVVDSGGDEEEESFSPSKRWPLIAPQYDRHAHSYGATLAWRF